MSVSYSKEERTGGGGAAGREKKGPSAKPDGCTTVFIGNLSYQINEDEVYEFFSTCGNIKEIRWNQGDFKGYGWVEFDDTNSPDEAMKLNGKDLAGRAIRIDYAAPKKSRPQW
jgi:nucleolin